MNRLQPQDIPQFLRRYRFPGGRVRAVRLTHSAKDGTAVEFRLAVREVVKDLSAEPRRVRLTLRVTGVEEYRFQMRPRQPKAKVTEARVAYLNGLFYVTFDALPLDPGERPQVFDFRASEVFAAGRDVTWEEVA